jgi:3D (Asp-Asp-Asp) domain-containing protein
MLNNTWHFHTKAADTMNNQPVKEAFDIKPKRNRTFKRIKKKYKRLAAALAGAAILSGVTLPSSPAAIVHASADPNPVNPPVTAEQQVAKPASNAPKEFKQELNIKATAYAPGPHDNDQWGNKTRLGTQIRPGVIAVDPSIIPLGSRVYIQYPDGHGEYAVAEDTGGAIKGNRIDIAKWTVNEAQDFGIQHVKVFVVSSPQHDEA